MIQKPFDDIDKDDIENLIEIEAAESKTLEFKSILPGMTRKDKKEFLADISSFANSSGGDVIYGISEEDEEGNKTGKASRVMPIFGENADDVIRRLDQLATSGTDPRMSVQIKPINGWQNANGQDGFVVLIRIPKSFRSPHRVTVDNGVRFFCRNSAGKYELDVDDLRDAFLATESQGERIKRFIEDRIAKIIANETPVRLSGASRLAVHIIPIGSFLNRKYHKLEAGSHLNIRPLGNYGGGGMVKYNLDGCYNAFMDGDESESYTQMFFDGTVEAVLADLLSDDQDSVCLEYCEDQVVGKLDVYIKNYLQLNIDAPVIISISLLGCKGMRAYIDRRRMRANSGILDRDVAILPVANLAQLTDVVIPELLKSTFDAAWNAFGFPRSYSYDENGKWKQ
ncbi:ATP-binding protein [Planctomycetota bacterium]|nr:ATP-binding protein [Planctomycetota bacterium]